MSSRPALRVEQLWLRDFRSHTECELMLHGGFTAILGSNGQGKTNLLEAVGYASRQQSIRGAPTEALVRSGAESAVVRAEVDRAGRSVLIEAEIPRRGRPRVLMNRQRVARRSDVLEVFQVSAFSPDDLELIKGGPSVRREFLDELVVAVSPRADAVLADVERIVRQRNALLKQVAGRLSAEAALTLDVWDQRFAAAADGLGDLRAGVLTQLEPVVAEAYHDVAGQTCSVQLEYEAPWRAIGMAAALQAGRSDDVRRGVSLIGPHRDDLVVRLNGLPTRHQASQGEQRSMAFALRLAAHRLVTAVSGVAPVLLLDDVFSELDADRSAALLRSLPPGQILLTSAVGLPAGATVDQVVQFEGGAVIRQ